MQEEEEEKLVYIEIFATCESEYHDIRRTI